MQTMMNGFAPRRPGGCWWTNLRQPVVFVMIDWCGVMKGVMLDAGAGGIKEVAHSNGAEEHVAFI